jgi:phage terminase Nu1 subunit (DNA packaging protein)
MIMPTKTKKPSTATPEKTQGHGGARAGAGRKTDDERESDYYRLFNRARAKEKVHLAKLAEFKEKLASGDLVAAADVRTEWAGVVSNVRSKLLMMPAKLAATALGATTFSEMQDLLTEAMHEVLQELSENA